LYFQYVFGGRAVIEVDADVDADEYDELID
jgi:hypothetical protein